MSSNLPTDPAYVIAFVTSRAETWAMNQPLIGSSPAEVAAVEVALAEAQEAKLAARQARDRARSATQRYYLATDRLRTLARVVVENAKSLAKATDDAGVYSKASLNPPKVRSRHAPLPGGPTNIAITLERNGIVNVRWTCKNPRGLHGVMYEVRRRILIVTERNGKSIARWSPFEVVGLAGGDKQLADATVPIGTGTLAYSVTSLHNGRRGGSSLEMPFQFGAAMPTISITTKDSQSIEPKMESKAEPKVESKPNAKPSLAA